MKKTEYETLYHCILFAGVEKNEIQRMTDEYRFTAMQYRKREVIFSPTQYTQSLAVILKGSCDVYKPNAESEMFLSILEKGQMFGMATLFYSDGFMNTVRAREDCKVMFITKKQLEAMFDANAQIRNNYIRLLSEKIHYLNFKLLCLSSPLPAVRVMNILTDLSQSQKSQTVTLKISLSTLAEELGLSRASLYRALDELEENGFMKRDGKTVTLLKTAEKL